MGKVSVGLTMSLDGFIAGPNDGPDNPLGDGGERLFRWYFTGDTEFRAPSGTMTFKVSSISAQYMRESWSKAGAFVTGRRTFEIANGWGGRHPTDVPVFVLTHTLPPESVRAGLTFTFVTDGLESALAQVQAVAGEKNVTVGAASLAQQCLRAGLLDELYIDLVPFLLGGGVRLFDNLGATPIDLECTNTVEAPGVTHLTYRVVK